ncbi:MAG: hypothetical protein ABI577_11680 [bacterium]
MSTKERLHQIIEEMNDHQATVLLMDLEVPPLTDDERAQIEVARDELRAGKGIPMDEAMRRLRAAG